MDDLLAAHATLIGKLLEEKPRRIVTARGADVQDINDREHHLRLITEYYLRYVKAAVEDVNQHLVAGKPINEVPFVTHLVEVAGDYLYEPLRAAADDTAAEWDWNA